MSVRGREWLAALEGGHRLQAYRDSGGVPTIGPGLTYYPIAGTRIRMGDTITRVQSSRLFGLVLQSFEALVDSVTRDDLAQHECDALVAFTYNIGSAFKGSTLLRRVNEHAPAAAVRAQFIRWKYDETDPDHPGLEEVPGLLRRRELEAEVYAGGPYVDQAGAVIPEPSV